LIQQDSQIDEAMLVDPLDQDSLINL